MKSFCRALFVVALSFASASLYALDRQSTADYHARRVALADKLNGGIAILFAAEEPLLDFMPYRQDEDFYYLTGWNEPGAALLIEAPQPAQGTHPARAYREVMFLPTRNLRTELYTGKKLDAASADASQITGVDEVKMMTDSRSRSIRLQQRIVSLCATSGRSPTQNSERLCNGRNPRHRQRSALRRCTHARPSVA